MPKQSTLPASWLSKSNPIRNESTPTITTNTKENEILSKVYHSRFELTQDDYNTLSKVYSTAEKRNRYFYSSYYDVFDNIYFCLDTKQIRCYICDIFSINGKTTHFVRLAGKT